MSWPLGKITQVYKGTDELVRATDFLINHKIYRRPIHKLVLLLGEEGASPPQGEDVQLTQVPE